MAPMDQAKMNELAQSTVLCASDNASDGDREVACRQHLRVLPPAANWYCAQACDWGYDSMNDRWIIAYGANSVICIYEFSATEPSTGSGKQAHSVQDTLDRPLRTQFVGLLRRGKKDGRVTSVRCVQDASGGLLLLCAGEEGAVQLWNPFTMERVDQHRSHKNTEVTCVTSRPEAASWFIAGDRQGGISVWQRDVPLVHIFTPLPRDAVFCMDIAPHDTALVAVGYRSGSLCLVDVVNKSIQHKLDGHELEVQAAVWSPSFQEEAYLATASRDRTIKVWTVPVMKQDMAETHEPAMVSRLEVRKPQQASSQAQANRLWLPLAWSRASHTSGKYGLWSGSFEGNLQLWQWSGLPKGTIKPTTIVKNGHNRLLFGIVPGCVDALPATSEDSLSRKLPTSFLLTISLDRDLRIWSEDQETNTSTLKLVERIPAQGGFVYSLDFNESRKILAFGVGDQTIRLWNLSGSKQSAGGYQSETVWKGMQSKVTCIRWHPLQDHVLAFGTEDGRIGTWDLRTKTTQRFKFSHGASIQDLVWGVHKQQTSHECSSNSFVESMKALEAVQADGLSLEDALALQVEKQPSSSHELDINLWSVDAMGKLCRTDVDSQRTREVEDDCGSFAWDPSFTALAIGRASGKVELFDWVGDAQGRTNGLSLQRFVHEHKDAVTSVAWSKTSVEGNQSTSLASGSKDGEILVYDFDEPGGVASTREPIVGYGPHVTSAFRSHTGQVNHLRWRDPVPREVQMLASCASDGLVCVWRMEEQHPVAVFRLHVGRTFAVEWLSPFIVASGGQDQTARLWDYRNHPYLPTEGTRGPTRHAPRVKTEASKAAPHDEGTALVSKPKENGKARTKKASKQSDAIMPDGYMAGVVYALAAATSQSSITEAMNSHRGLLDDARDQLQKNEDWERTAQVLLLQGRVADALRLVASHGALNSSWVAYAPMAGQDVWREIAGLYAIQLQNGGKHKEAALQYLAIGKVDSAIGAFRSGDMLPEATSLTISLYGPQSELLSSILWDQAAQLEKKKEVHAAVETYLSLSTHEARMRAVNLLTMSGGLDDARRGLALYSAVQETATLPTSVLLSILTLAVMQSDFKVAKQVLSVLAHESDGGSHVSSTLLLYKLCSCVVGICDLLVCAQGAEVGDAPDGAQSGEADDNTIKFISLLQDSLAETDSSVRTPALPVWSRALDVCKRIGIWTSTSDVTMGDAIDLLAEQRVIKLLLPSSPLSDEDSSQGVIVRVAHHVLKVLVELFNSYHISALEALRDLLRYLIQVPDAGRWMKILFSSGIVDVTTPPLFGELGDEPADTRVLWIECFLRQCDVFVSHYVSVDSADERRSMQDHAAKLEESIALLFSCDTVLESLEAYATEVRNRLITALTQDTA